jgi:hypothetical protein
MMFRRFKFEIFFTIPLCAVAVALAGAALVTQEWAKGGLAYTLTNGGVTGDPSEDGAGDAGWQIGLWKGEKTVIVAGSTKYFELNSKIFLK